MRSTSPRRIGGLATWLAALGVLALAAFPALGIEADRPYPAELASKMVADPAFEFPNYSVPLSALPPALSGQLDVDQLRADLATLGVDPRFAFYDVRGGRLKSFVVATPLVPGPGAGNDLSWAGLGIAAPANDAAYEATVLAAFKAYLLAHREQLGIDLDELETSPNVAVHDRRRLAHVWADRVVDGVPVRGSSVSATINSGNLVLFNARNWGPIDVPTTPSISKEVALAAVESHVTPYVLGKQLLPTALALVAQSDRRDPLVAAAAGAAAYRYRLAWVVTAALAGEAGTWEALVDAHSGRLLSFTDVNHYVVRRTVGGILPLSNDELDEAGREQPGHPMPYATLVKADGTTVTTSSTGLADLSGPFSTSLTGPYVDMADTCGPISERTTCNDLDLGTNAGTDCDVPAGAGSAGNTRSSRTGFYELNRLIELWRSRAAPGEGAFTFLNGLPTPVQANMNIVNACNAFFSPALPNITFFRSGTVIGSSGRRNICRNTGEIAAVFDHEYGHYLDFMDGNAMSSSSEGYADAVSILRLNDSCVGRGFFIESAGSTNPASPNPYGAEKCGGDGDFCRTCTGVREADWKKRHDQAPHDVDWINRVNPRHPTSGCKATAGSPAVPTPPPPGLSGAPCGSGLVHCEGQLISEAVVDLYTRDLRCQGLGWENQASATGNDVAGGRCVGDQPPTMSEGTALEVATLLFSSAKGNIQAWFECSAQFGGCNADSGFQQFLAADDDNGTLVDGTPHGVAIFDAFARHQMACPLLGALVKNGGCTLAAPRTIRGLAATAGLRSVSLDWDDEAGAAQYWVFRTEGVDACKKGKARIATLTAGVDGSRFTDTGLLESVTYAYTVMGVGAPGCVSAMSACATVAPLSDGDLAPVAANVAVVQNGLEITGGDGDEFLDNCESATLSFTVLNQGNATAASSRVVAIRPLSHPATVVHTALPLALASGAGDCGAGALGAAFSFSPKGLRYDESLLFEVDLQLGAVAKTVTLALGPVESDPFVPTAQAIFDFENGLQGWTVPGGVYSRKDAPPGGAPAGEPVGLPTTWYMASSTAVDSACDRLRSPAMKLTSTSTLSLYNQFAIEPTSQAAYDRANVGLVDAATGERTVVSPSAGRTYNVPGGDGANPANFFCTENQAGWNGAGPGWLSSTWSATDLEAAGAAGRAVFVEIASGTDGNTAALGLFVDQVKVTNVLTRGPDQQPDNCNVPVAGDDGYNLGLAQFVAVPPPGVLANDADADGDALTAVLVSGPANGTLTFNADGSFAYGRKLGFRGTDSFTYRASDGVRQSNLATVTITAP